MRTLVTAVGDDLRPLARLRAHVAYDALVVVRADESVSVAQLKAAEEGYGGRITVRDAPAWDLAAALEAVRAFLSDLKGHVIVHPSGPGILGHTLTLVALERGALLLWGPETTNQPAVLLGPIRSRFGPAELKALVSVPDGDAPQQHAVPVRLTLEALPGFLALRARGFASSARGAPVLTDAGKYYAAPLRAAGVVPSIERVTTARVPPRAGARRPLSPLASKQGSR